MKLTIKSLAAEIFPQYLIYVFTSSLRNVSYKFLFFNTALQHAGENKCKRKYELKKKPR